MATFNMLLNLELRCSDCRAIVNTSDFGSDCECENIHIQRIKNPITEDESAEVTVKRTEDAEVGRRDHTWVPFLDVIHFGKEGENDGP